MINGIFILADGTVQQIGNIHSLQGIIDAMKTLLPDLEEQESLRILRTLDDTRIAELRKKLEAG